MTVPTHILLASKIFKAVSGASPLVLDQRWFIYGNVYPDLSHYMFSAPHFAALSIGFVRNMVETLCEYPANADITDPILSFRLGIMCHYLCDFFCHVHSKSFTGPRRGHHMYELRQQALLMRHPRLIGRKAVAFLRPELHGSAALILKALDEAQDAYANAPHRADTDLVLAVKFAATAVASVMNICAESALGRPLAVSVQPA